MRYAVLSWVAFNTPNRVWMALPNDWRRWWAAEWIVR